MVWRVFALENICGFSIKLLRLVKGERGEQFFGLTFFSLCYGRVMPPTFSEKLYYGP